MSKRTRRRLAAGIKRGQFKQSLHQLTPTAMGLSAPVKAGSLTVLDGAPDPSDVRRSALIRGWLAELQGELGHWESVSEVREVGERQWVELQTACRRAALTDRQTAATLSYLEAGSLQRSAHELGISIRALRDRLDWARRKLRALFDKTPLDSLYAETA